MTIASMDMMAVLSPVSGMLRGSPYHEAHIRPVIHLTRAVTSGARIIAPAPDNLLPRPHCDGEGKGSSGLGLVSRLGRSPRRSGPLAAAPAHRAAPLAGRAS